MKKELAISGIKGLETKDLKQIEGGSIIAALTLGLGAMALAYQIGKDAAKFVKKYESR